MKGNFNYLNKGGQGISKQKLGEKMFCEGKFGPSNVNVPTGKDEKSPGVVHGSYKTDRGSFVRK